MSNYFLKLYKTKTAVLVALFGVVPPIIFLLNGRSWRWSRIQTVPAPSPALATSLICSRFYRVQIFGRSSATRNLSIANLVSQTAIMLNEWYQGWHPQVLQFLITIQNCFRPTELKYWRTCGIVVLVLLFICFLVIIALIIRPVSVSYTHLTLPTNREV